MYSNCYYSFQFQHNLDCFFSFFLFFLLSSIIFAYYLTDSCLVDPINPKADQLVIFLIDYFLCFEMMASVYDFVKAVNQNCCYQSYLATHFVFLMDKTNSCLTLIFNLKIQFHLRYLEFLSFLFMYFEFELLEERALKLFCHQVIDLDNYDDLQIFSCLIHFFFPLINFLSNDNFQESFENFGYCFQLYSST